MNDVLCTVTDSPEKYQSPQNRSYHTLRAIFHFQAPVAAKTEVDYLQNMGMMSAFLLTIMQNTHSYFSPYKQRNPVFLYKLISIIQMHNE